jgi:hypothetical protein
MMTAHCDEEADRIAETPLDTIEVAEMVLRI